MVFLVLHEKGLEMSIIFANSWKNQPVRPWTELERMAFGLVVEIFTRLAETSKTLQALVNLISEIRFCVPPRILLQLNRNGRRQTLQIGEDVSNQKIVDFLSRRFQINVAPELFAPLGPGIWSIEADTSGKYLLSQSYGHYVRAPDTNEHMICICPSIFSCSVVTCCILCEELAHVRTKKAHPTISTKELEQEGIAARKEFLIAARENLSPSYADEIIKCERECAAEEAYWSSIDAE